MVEPDKSEDLMNDQNYTVTACADNYAVLCAAWAMRLPPQSGSRTTLGIELGYRTMQKFDQLGLID